MIDVSVVIARVIGESGQEMRPIIVVAHKQPNRAGQGVKGFAQRLIRFGLAPMGQISGNHNPVCVVVVGAHLIQGLRKAAVRIKPTHSFARAGQMNVRDVNEFHTGRSLGIWVRPPQEQGDRRGSLAVW